MQTLQHAAVISAVPIQDLLMMGIVFTLAALILTAVSIDAGNYPKVSAAMRGIHRALHRRPPHHWPAEDYVEGRRLTGH